MRKRTSENKLRNVFNLEYLVCGNMATPKPKPRPLPERKYTPFRLSIDAVKIIDALVLKRGISRASVVEWALREMAKEYGVNVGD